MKKIFLVLFIVSQFINVNTLKASSVMLHTHTHVSIEGVEHIHEHKHAEPFQAFYFQKDHNYMDNFLSKLTYSKTQQPPLSPLMDAPLRPPII